MTVSCYGESETCWCCYYWYYYYRYYITLLNIYIRIPSIKLTLLNNLDVSYPISSAHSRVDLRSIPPELLSAAELFVSKADFPASPEHEHQHRHTDICRHLLRCHRLTRKKPKLITRKEPMKATLIVVSRNDIQRTCEANTRHGFTVWHAINLWSWHVDRFFACQTVNSQVRLTTCWRSGSLVVECWSVKSNCAV